MWHTILLSNARKVSITETLLPEFFTAGGIGYGAVYKKKVEGRVIIISMSFDSSYFQTQ